MDVSSRFCLIFGNGTPGAILPRVIEAILYTFAVDERRLRDEVRRAERRGPDTEWLTAHDRAVERFKVLRGLPLPPTNTNPLPISRIGSKRPSSRTGI